jgi:hypothetical protein
MEAVLSHGMAVKGQSWDFIEDVANALYTAEQTSYVLLISVVDMLGAVQYILFLFPNSSLDFYLPFFTSSQQFITYPLTHKLIHSLSHNNLLFICRICVLGPPLSRSANRRNSLQNMRCIRLSIKLT